MSSDENLTKNVDFTSCYVILRTSRFFLYWFVVLVAHAEASTNLLLSYR